MLLRVICIRFFAFLFALVVLPASYLYAQPDGFPSEKITQLAFTPMANNGNLAIAEANGRTWVRGYIPNDLIGMPVIFQIPSARILNYHFYVPRGDKLVPIPRNTDSRSGHFRSRFPQHALVPQDSVYYLEINNHPPQLLDIQLQERSQFWSSESVSLLRIGLYYGLALMSVIFNVVFYLIFKDKRFITYCILLFTTFISFFYEDGMFYYFSDGRLIKDYLIVLNSAVSSIVAVLFTFHFLDLNTVFQRFKKWFIAVAALMLTGVLVYALTDSPAVQMFVYGLCFLSPVSCLYLAARQFRKDVYARFLVLTFGFVVLTGMLYVLYTRVDSSAFAWFGIHTFRLVSAIEIISISFAIIFKARALQRENDRYREELDNYLKALEIKAADEQLRKNGTATHPSQAFTKPVLAETLKAQYDLTEREIDVLLCIWDGLTNKEIAERLFITVSTTKYHVSNLYLKLDVKNRNQVQVLRESISANGFNGTL